MCTTLRTRCVHVHVCATQILAAAIIQECMATISFHVSGCVGSIREQRLIERIIMVLMIAKPLRSFPGYRPVLNCMQRDEMLGYDVSSGTMSVAANPSEPRVAYMQSLDSPLTQNATVRELEESVSYVFSILVRTSVGPSPMMEACFMTDPSGEYFLSLSLSLSPLFSLPLPLSLSFPSSIPRPLSFL